MALLAAVERKHFVTGELLQRKTVIDTEIRDVGSRPSSAGIRTGERQKAELLF